MAAKICIRNAGRNRLVMQIKKHITTTRTTATRSSLRPWSLTPGERMHLDYIKGLVIQIRVTTCQTMTGKIFSISECRLVRAGIQNLHLKYLTTENFLGGEIFALPYAYNAKAA